MTRLVRSFRKTPSASRKKQPARRTRAVWALQDAKARFSEVVRRAREGEPQRVTLHGKDAVVVISAEEYATLSIRKKYPTLSSLLKNSPLRDIDIEFEPVYVTVRPPVKL
jgi:prevent-host-death family protein